MSEKTWMPFYIGDYLGATQRLTAEQHGAYLMLMLDYWRNGPPPNDDDVLDNITKNAWSRNKKALMGFFEIDGDVLRHSRIDEELEEAADKHAKAKDKAKQAANKRWGNDVSGNASSNAPSTAQAMLNPCPSPSPSPSPSQLPKQSPSKESPQDAPRGGDFDDFWNAYPRKISKGAALKAWKAAIKKTSPESLLAAVTAHGEHWRTEKTESEFIPHPATWLNGERWSDDLSKPEKVETWRQYCPDPDEAPEHAS